MSLALSNPVTFFPHVVLKARLAAVTATSMSLGEATGHKCQASYLKYCITRDNRTNDFFRRGIDGSEFSIDKRNFAVEYTSVRNHFWGIKGWNKLIIDEESSRNSYLLVEGGDLHIDSVSHS